MSPWDFFQPAEGQWYRWRLNGGAAFLCKSGLEWRYAVKTKTRAELDQVFDGPEAVDEPRGLEQALVISAGKIVALRPTMINKPIVIEARNLVQVLRNQEIALSIDLPVSVHFELENGDTLCRLNTFFLAKTWFGDTSAGILCFSWPLQLIPISPGDPLAGIQYGSMLRCRVLIRNFAKQSLELKHFAVYTEMLDIWQRDGQLATDTVVLEGLSDGNLKMSVVANAQSRRGQHLYHATLGQTELLVKRGVSFLRNITGIT